MKKVNMAAGALAATVLSLAAGPAAASPALAAKAGCAVCHAADKPLMGPSWQAVAAKYKGQATAAAQLADKVRKGSVGVWGKLPMPPTPDDKASDADLKALVSWVLKSR
jgi:cytochrome c